MVKPQKISRKDQILQALAHMLETSPGVRITTSALAKEVGVSEAALYRHFPSKAKMFEGLIEFIEETLFSRIALILDDEPEALKRCEKILTLLLTFCERNPGLTRIINGDALAGEPDRLRHRMIQLFDRLETQIKQILREAELNEGLRTRSTVGTTSNMILALAEGRIGQFVRSEFKRKPTELWQDQWRDVSAVVFR
ncbi:TetR family transcriptional regulator [Endozoicomonas montiporae]|uniref:Nucleoid occlusion factor SlmA n=2 Tax=Endozoicomonas montiporae TaxID=1027273 RepID=A0A081N0I5_9GAMM|nr:nucleoid occlusion factor SlmA [Endozoicomonas montiporae]AMO54420.1 division inhibitor protein [Endozoicomonas montiporae CL-33]KEQ11958.1 TetR family transcriptional regulator [Endozoicomonas montiporae]